MCERNITFAPRLSYGVMVALQFLVLSVVVRIRLGQLKSAERYLYLLALFVSPCSLFCLKICLNGAPFPSILVRFLELRWCYSFYGMNDSASSVLWFLCVICPKSFYLSLSIMSISLINPFAVIIVVIRNAMGVVPIFQWMYLALWMSQRYNAVSIMSIF